MKYAIASFLAMLLLASFAWSQSVTPRKSSGSKENLDLPFDARGEDSEEEEREEQQKADNEQYNTQIAVSKSKILLLVDSIRIEDRTGQVHPRCLTVLP